VDDKHNFYSTDLMGTAQVALGTVTSQTLQQMLEQVMVRGFYSCTVQGQMK
jgi:hypothetical protein